MHDERFKIFTGTANPALADSICHHLNVPLGKALLGRFSDGEIYFQILENVRGADVFVVQPCCYPVDNHLMELLLMIDAFKRASAWRITAVFAVLLLCAPGPQRQASRSDLREAGRRPARDCRCEPRADVGFARAADSRLFQRSGGSLVRFPGADRLFQAE